MPRQIFCSDWLPKGESWGYPVHSGLPSVPQNKMVFFTPYNILYILY